MKVSKVDNTKTAVGKKRNQVIGGDILIRGIEEKT